MTPSGSGSPSPSAAGRPSGTLTPRVAAIIIILVAIDLRPGIVSVGPALGLIRAEFALTHASAALLTAIPDVAMGALALPTPWLARRFGRDRVMLAALGTLFVSVCGRAFVRSTPLLLVSTAGVGAGIAIAGTLVAGFIKQRFPAKAAAMVGVYASALSFGSLMAALLTGPVASGSGGWRWAVGVWGLLGPPAMMVWLFMQRVSRDDSGVPAQQTQYRLPVARLKAWRIAIFFGFQNLLFYSCIAWIAPLYQERGAGAPRAGLILAAFTIAFFVANPLFSNLSRSPDRRRPLALAALSALAGFLGWAIAPEALPFLWVSMIALGLGGAFTLGMTLPLDNTRDAAEADLWNAFVLTIGYLIAAAGPLIFGRLRDATGGFFASLWFVTGIAFAMALLVPFLGSEGDRHGSNRAASK